MKLKMMNDSIRNTVENVVARAPAKPRQRPEPQGPQRAGKKDKKAKKSKHAKSEKEPKDTKGKKEKKDKKDKKKKKGKGGSDSSSGKSSSSAWLYKGKPCTVTAISYETDPPHAVVRTADNREVVVGMNALVHRSKRKRKTAEKPQKPSQPITIECSSSGSASEESDSGIEVVAELPGPGAAAPAGAVPAGEVAREGAGEAEEAKEEQKAKEANEAQKETAA